MIVLPKTFGIPPIDNISQNIQTTSMPYLELFPKEPAFSDDMMFTTDDAYDAYKNLLEKYDFRLQSNMKAIRCAYVADNFPTDSFSNELTEGFLQNMSTMASSNLGIINQMFGGADAIASVKKLIKAVEPEKGGMIKSSLGMINKGLDVGRTTVDALQHSKNKIAHKLGTGMESILQGARIDFPKYWANSRFNPSYTATIRLYNPEPSNDDLHDKLIVGPVCALLLLTLPRSTTGGFSYKWPFFVEVKSPGIYHLPAALISNIAIVKGGDQQQIAYNQRLSVIDVRIDFVSLYDTMVTEEDNIEHPNRPTLRQYIASLRDQKESWDTSFSAAAASELAAEDIFTNNMMASADTNTGDLTKKPANRVIAKDASVSAELSSQSSFYNNIGMA